MMIMFKKGGIPWNKGTHGVCGLRKANSGSFKKGHKTWNKGLRGAQVSWIKGLTKATDPRVKKISEALKGVKKPWMSRRFGYVGHNKGRVICQEERLRISKGVKRARRTHSPIWNKGLTKKDHPGIASAAKLNSLSQKGKPRPFVSNRQGRRRFWYYGRDQRLKMRSRWEVAYAHWLDSKSLVWLYEPVTFVANVFSYTPDFYLPKIDGFVELKGWENNSYNEKISAVRTQWGCKLVVLQGDDLRKLGILDRHYRVVAKGRGSV